jgi:hypothetical protein
MEALSVGLLVSSGVERFIELTVCLIVQCDYLLQVAAVVKLCVQPEPSYRPLITDVLQSLLPLVPIELGGAWRDTKARKTRSKTSKSCPEVSLNMDPDPTK